MSRRQVRRAGAQHRGSVHEAPLPSDGSYGLRGLRRLGSPHDPRVPGAVPPGLDRIPIRVSCRGEATSSRDLANQVARPESTSHKGGSASWTERGAVLVRLDVPVHLVGAQVQPGEQIPDALRPVVATTNSASLDRLHVENGNPWSTGLDNAIFLICCRCGSVNVGGRPSA